MTRNPESGTGMVFSRVFVLIKKSVEHPAMYFFGGERVQYLTLLNDNPGPYLQDVLPCT